MTHAVKKPDFITRLTMLAITGVLWTLGAMAILMEYAPERWGKLGYTPPLFGHDAKLFGVTLILVGVIPLLLFCRSKNQAAWLGALLGVAILTILFAGIYGYN